MQLTPIALAVAFLLGPCFSVAQTARKPGDALTYEAVNQTQVGGGGLPHQAYGTHPIYHTAFKIAILSVDANQNAQVHVTIQESFPEIHGRTTAIGMATAKAQLESQNRYKQFDARFTREGALLITVDNDQQDEDSTKGKSLAQARDAMVGEVQDPAFQIKMAKNETVGAFLVLNAIALSCGKRTSFATGDAWHVVSKSDGATYDIAVKGTQPYHGHDTVLLSAKSHLDNPGGSNDIDATVYYDPQTLLVIGLHSVNANSIHATGVTSTTTSDLNLKE